MWQGESPPQRRNLCINTRKQYEREVNSIARKGQGRGLRPVSFSLAGSRGSAPCGVWGNAPTVPRTTNSKGKANKGAGSEASLPVTLRIRRCAPKLLYPPLAYCRARWARPTFRPKRQTRNTAYTAAFRRFLSSRLIPSQSKHTSCRPPSCIRECCWRGSFQVRADTSG